jgi:DNA-binding transcriptional regulator YiaG
MTSRSLPEAAIERLRVARRARDLPPAHTLKKLRIEANASRADIAAALGVSTSAVRLYEEGQRRPRPLVANRYLDLIDALRRL